MSSFDRFRQRMARDRHAGWLGGVCAGIARHFHTDPVFLRIAFVVAGTFAWKVTLATYIVAWILLPSREH